MPSDVLGTILNLLSRAERSDSPAEAELAARHVQRLARIHSIDLETIRQQRDRDEKPTQPEVRVVVIGEKGHNFITAYLDLFSTIAKQNDVKWYFQGGRYKVNAIGFPFDLEVTVRLYAYLLAEMVSTGEAHIESGVWRDDTHHGKTVTSREARLSFYQAFSDQIGRRLKEERESAEREAAAKARAAGERHTELVLVDKDSTLRNMYRNEYSGRATNTRSPMKSATAREDGASVGRNVKLRPDKEIDGGRKAIEAS